MILRDYQRAAVDSVYSGWTTGVPGNYLIVAPTGSGKSIIICTLVKELHEQHGARILMLTHVKELIEQSAKKLIEHWPFAPMGIVSAGLGKKELHDPIVFAGIQSFEKHAHKRDAFETVIIDSVTELSKLMEAEILIMDGKAKSINTALGGYGAGYRALAALHYGIRAMVQELIEKKAMTVIFIAHADVENVREPDNDDYNRYTLRMHKDSVSNYSDNVDIVAFVKLKTFVTGEENKKKAISTGERIITCYPTASHISKNRYGITQDIPFILGQNPFASIV